MISQAWPNRYRGQHGNPVKKTPCSIWKPVAPPTLASSRPLVGFFARQHVAPTLAKSNGRDAQYVGALALAVIGDSARAQALAEDLQKRFPDDTVVRFNYLPTLHAQLFLSAADHSPDRSHENAAKAIQALAVALPYELGVPANGTFWINLY